MLPQTGQACWRCNPMLLKAMRRALMSSMAWCSSLGRPHSSLMASAAWIEPTMPVIGANTPMVAQRASSGTWRGSKVQA